MDILQLTMPTMVQNASKIYFKEFFNFLLFSLAYLLTSCSSQSETLCIYIDGRKIEVPALSEIVVDKYNNTNFNQVMMETTFKFQGENNVYGTGFLLNVTFDFKRDSNIRDSNIRITKFIMVTAAHVLDQMQGDWITIDLRKKNDGKIVADPTRVRVKIDGTPLYTKHPRVDVAVMAMAFTESNISLTPIIHYSLLSTQTNLSNFGIFSGESVNVLGFPDGKTSREGAYPINRKGFMTSIIEGENHSSDIYLVDYNIDYGDSGGPVIINKTYLSNEKQNGISEKKIRLILGLVSDKITLTRKDGDDLVLGKVIPAKYIIETIRNMEFIIKFFSNNSFYIFPLVGPYDSEDMYPNYKDEDIFVYSSVSRIKNEVSDQSVIDDLTILKEKWQEADTEENLNVIAEHVTLIATEKGIQSKVTISTCPTNGLNIKYQTVASKRRNESPLTAKQLTTCNEIIPIGRYHIWAEKSGNILSSKNDVFDITKPSEEVVLEVGNVRNKGSH